MTPHCPEDVFSRSSRGRSEDVLKLSLRDVRLGRPQDVISRRSQDVISRRPRDGQIGSLGDVLGTLEGDILGMSWGPIFAGWVKVSIICHYVNSQIQ